MPPTDFTAMPCPVARSMAVLGERWAILVMREAFYGSTRFDEFEKNLGIAPNILSARLKTLVTHGLLARVTPEGGGRHVYQLTEKGRDFFPAYVALKAWADRWMTDEKGPLTVLQDKQSGTEIATPTLTRADGSAITLDDVRVLPGPARAVSCDAALAKPKPDRRTAMPETPAMIVPGTAATAASAEPVPATEVARRIGSLAGPTAVIALLQAGAQLVETWLAARQGTAALAGWAVVLPFALLLQQMSAGAMGGGVVSAIARALGANKREEASSLVLHALIIAVTAGLVFAIVLAGFPRGVLGAVAGVTAAEAAATYAIWLFGAGAVPVWLANTLASVLRGGGRHALAARVLGLMWVAFPLLSWLLAEPMGMGLAGIGAALAAVSWAAALAMVVVVARGGAGFVPVLRMRPSGACSRASCRSGWWPARWPRWPT